jgi:hypothetical protein
LAGFAEVEATSRIEVNLFFNLIWFSFASNSKIKKNKRGHFLSIEDCDM